MGHPGFMNRSNALPMEGGVRVFINGRLAGAVGVASSASPDDGKLATRVAALIASGEQ